LLNWIFAFFIVGAVIAGAFGGRMPEVTKAGLDSAKSAVVDLVIPLVGQMALWLGFMRVLREGGLLAAIARALAPGMRRLFPDVPPDHPAMGAMILNLAANMLGLGNAATPFGLKAMRELDTLNAHRGVATDAMALFLSINTAGVAVLPLGVVAVRATLGSQNAGGIIVPSILSAASGTLVAILVAKALERRPFYSVERAARAVPGPAVGGPSIADAIKGLTEAEAIAHEGQGAVRGAGLLLLGFVALLAVAIGMFATGAPEGTGGVALARDVLSTWLLPALMAAIVLFGLGHRVPVYEAFVRGAREGFEIAVMIIPFIVAILVSIGMFRASGMLDVLLALVAPITNLIGFPAEALPMALIRPLSGSAALGVLTETMKVHGPDSFVGFLVSVINGSTETTFYVLAVYFGSVQVRAARHTVAACLAADAAGIGAAYLFSRVFFS
jgi:spore maturation protein SpmA